MLFCSGFCFLQMALPKSTVPYAHLRIFGYLLLLITFASGQISNQQTLTFSVVEEGPVDTPVGSVSAASLDDVPVTDRPQLSYSLQAKDSSQEDLFKIDRQSGNITVAKTIDRETICPHTSVCVLHFSAIVNGGEFIARVVVDITVEDINDNNPKFDPSGVFEVRFPESSPKGSSRPLLTATDADTSEAFGVQRYDLQPSSSIFTLEISDKAVGSPQLNLVLLEPLDRETDANYTLRLAASDGGDPPKVGTLTVRVVVEDSNDNAPNFTQTTYSASFSETEGEGYEIVKVHATDKDKGKNSRLEYSLSTQQPGNNPENINGKVMINSGTGSVTLSQPLRSGSYTIWVEVRDMGDSRLTDQTTINVTVLDTDNNKPVARLRAVPLGGLPEGWVSETESVGGVVGVLDVTDPDSGNNGNVSCFSLESHFKLERLDPNSYKLILAQELDYETDREHNVEAVCRDQGSPSLDTTAAVVVKVKDENDNVPEFTKDIYEEGIFENNVVGDTVVVVTAMDLDSGERGRVKYTLLQDAGNNFTVSANDGVIRASISFDRETKDFYQFTVLASDDGKPSLNSTATVRIRVRDKNDVPPVFGRPKYKFHLYENREVDSIVGNITVSDPDLLDGGRIKLSLVFDDEESDETVFRIDNSAIDPFSISDDGKIYSQKVFDREHKPSYSFYIIATDGGQRKLSTSVEAVVEILDVNDHRPTFSFPSEHNFSALANIPIHSDTSVLRVDVTDMDAGKNSIVSYSIVATNASTGLFRIGKFSGEIVASRDIGRADLGTFFITVNASDQGSPPLWENRTLHLVIQAEAAKSSDEVIADQNVLIVVCIVCFTVIVSGGIFIALCVLRRLDRQRKLQYTSSCCPGNGSDLDSSRSNEDPAPQQYDLAPPGGKESNLKSGGHNALSQYHEYPNNHLAHQMGPSGPKGGDGPGTQVYSMGSHSGYAPTSGGRAVPLSTAENHKRLATSAPPRQEDHHSTSSTETATGDSGHGSDEEFSNSLEHSSAPPTLPANLAPNGASASTTANKSPFNAAAAGGGGAAPAPEKLNGGAVHRFPYGGASSHQPPHDVSYTSTASSLRGGQFHNAPGSGASVRSAGKLFPFTDRGSLAPNASRGDSPGQFTAHPQQQQFPLTAIPPQRRKNSSVRFHPLVTDLCEQAGQGQPNTKVQSQHIPLAGRGGHNGSSNSVSGYSTGTPMSPNAPPPPPPPSRHQKRPQQSQHPPHLQHQQPFLQQHPSSLPLSQPYQKQHSLLPPLSTSSSSSSPLNISDSKLNMRLHSSVGSGVLGKHPAQLSPLSRSFTHEPTEESDLNTTTSGSYSVASDDVECRLNDFGDAADAYV